VTTLGWRDCAAWDQQGRNWRPRIPATALTILDEVLDFPPHLIEHRLAHAVRDPLGRAYNRTAHLPGRRKMMQDWADYLYKLKAEVAGEGLALGEKRLL